MCVEGTYWGPRWPYIIAYLVFSLFLIPFCYSQICLFFFFKFQMTCVCIHEVCSPARPGKSEEGARSPGAGAEGSCELNTWHRR